MKAFRVPLMKKNPDMKLTVYITGESEERVRKEAERIFYMFDTIGKIKDITNTKKGQKLLSI